MNSRGMLWREGARLGVGEALSSFKIFCRYDVVRACMLGWRIGCLILGVGLRAGRSHACGVLTVLAPSWGLRLVQAPGYYCLSWDLNLFYWARSWLL